MLKTIQLLEISAIENFPRDLENSIVQCYQEDICGSDTYVRYYPSDPIEGLNEWLSLNGLQVNVSDEYFYILIRIDW